MRYVDDFALFGGSKRELWSWKQAIVDRLARLRLTVHAGAAQVTPVAIGIPWLGFVVYPTHRRVKARNVRDFTRRLRARWAAYCDGAISFAEFDARLASLPRSSNHSHTRCGSQPLSKRARSAGSMPK